MTMPAFQGPCERFFSFKRKYSGLDLKVFRYCNRNQRLSDRVVYLLSTLGLFKSFDHRRGSSAGIRRTCTQTYNIPVFCASRRKIRVTRAALRSAEVSHLVRVERLFYHYKLPRILYSNVRSLANKFDETCAIVAVQNPDVMVFTETWVTNVNCAAFEIDGYCSIHRVRKREDKSHGGGVAVYLKADLSIIASKISQEIGVEVITVQFRSNYLPCDLPWFAIISVYSPPNNPFGVQTLEYVVSEIDRLLLVNSEASVFVIGDFNDLNLWQLNVNHSFSQLIKEPTRNDKMLDLCYYKGNKVYKAVNMAPIAFSDHCVVTISPEQESIVNLTPHYVNIRPKKKSYMDTFRDVVAAVDWVSLLNEMNCEEATDFFHTFVKRIYLEAFPCRRIKKKRYSQRWLTQQIIDAVNQRNKMHSLGDYNHEKLLAVKIKSMVFIAKKKLFEKLSSEVCKGSFEYFNFIKMCAGFPAKKRIIQFEGLTKEQSYQVLFQHCRELACSHSGLEQSIVDDLPQDSFIPPIEEYQVFRELCGIKSNSASAPDGIPNFIFKEFALEMSCPISLLINKSLQEAICPVTWRKSFVFMIPKVRNPKTRNDYRPITISSVIAKICEKHIYSNLLPLIRDKIDYLQFGCVPGRSVTQYLVFYMDFVLKNLDRQGVSVASLFTDFHKAFDSIDHNVFVNELIKINPNNQITRWIASFINNRPVVFKSDDNEKFGTYIALNGTPQGSVLGGLIFAITINDIARDLSNRLKYVDDLTTMCAFSSGEDLAEIQRMASMVHRDSDVVKMVVNQKKSCYMIHEFKRGGPRDLGKVVIIGDEIIHRTDSIKLLGVVIQHDLRWNQHVELIVTRANQRFFILYRLKRLGMAPLQLVAVYSVFIRPLLEFCSEIWGPSITKRQIGDLERVQKRALRIALGNEYVSYELAINKLGIDSLSFRRKNRLFSFATSFFTQFPQLLPGKCGELSGRITRNYQKIYRPWARTVRYQNSPLYAMIDIINNGVQ